jgi:hypothetical protein
MIGPQRMDEFLFLQLFVTAFFSIWLAVDAVKHLLQYRRALGAVTSYLHTYPSTSEASPSLPIEVRRRVFPPLFSLALIVLIVLQMSIAVLFGLATVNFLQTDFPEGFRWATYAFASFIGLWIVLLLAYSWFPHWVPEDAVGRGHLALVVLGTIGFGLAAFSLGI